MNIPHDFRPKGTPKKRFGAFYRLSRRKKRNKTKQQFSAMVTLWACV